VIRAVGDTAEARRQDKRRTAALRLVRRADLHLELTADRKVLVQGEATPEVVATVRELRAELAEFLEGHRCLACGGLIHERVQGVPLVGGGRAHAWNCGRRG
jgi:hypothetical protein